jgi:hypothetical protein
MNANFKKRIEAERAADVPGVGAAVCPVGGCRCPTCRMTELVLRSVLKSDGFTDTDRVTIRATTCGDGSYPYLASVRVDGNEVYRIHDRPDEVFADDVLEDITKALRRPV